MLRIIDSQSKVVRKGPTETPVVQMEPGPSNNSQGRPGGEEDENFSRRSHVNARGRPWTQNSHGGGGEDGEASGSSGRCRSWQCEPQTPGRGAWSFEQDKKLVDYVARQIKTLEYVNEPSSSGVSTNNQNNKSGRGMPPESP